MAEIWRQLKNHLIIVCQGYTQVRDGGGTELFAKIDSVVKGKTDDPFTVPDYPLLVIGISSAFLLVLCSFLYII